MYMNIYRHYMYKVKVKSSLNHVNVFKYFVICDHFVTVEVIYLLKCNAEAEFKEFEPWLKFKPRLKNGWFHLKLYQIFQDLSRRSIETGF